MNPVKKLFEFGQSPWLDYIERGLLQSGFDRLIEEDGIRGVTSNPSILAKAVIEHNVYQEIICELRCHSRSVEALYEALAIEDIRMAADRLLPLYQQTDGLDGYVSLEVSPDIAYDAETTIREAQRLWHAVDRSNLMVKVPATKPGLIAIRQLTALGKNINATLIFSPTRYVEVAEAWQAGLTERAARGEDITRVASVASYFVSRIETLADRLLAEKSEQDPTATRWQGRIAVASAKVAYQHFKALHASEAWQHLIARGAHPQRLLWASTSTKNPAYSDVKYVDELVGPQTVNTLPPKTLDAYRDHGDPAPRLESDIDGAEAALAALEGLGIRFEDMARQLEQEGVEKFQASYCKLLAALADGDSPEGQRAC